MSSTRCLWKDPNDDDTNGNKETKNETYESVLKQFCSKPQTCQSFPGLCSNAIVVGQEFVLVCLFLARHRMALWQEEHHNNSKADSLQLHLQEKIDRSQVLAMIALLVIVIYANSKASAPPQQPRKAKVKQRISDAILLAILLRMLSAVLQTLTASYSSDTVESLTVGGMLVHWLSCDYSYANGNAHESQQSTIDSNSEDHSETISSSSHPSSQRPSFRGGTVSLNAAFFSTILLASRLHSNATVYLFISSAVIMFAFYPATRHAISHHPQRTYSKCLHTVWQIDDSIALYSRW